MRTVCIAIVSIFLGGPSLAETAAPHCAPSLDTMPQSWRPADDGESALTSSSLWTEREAKDAEHAIRIGLDEMIGHLDGNASAIRSMWEDSVAAMIEVTYSSANNPVVDAKARAAAERNLGVLIEPFLEHEPASATCEEFAPLLPLAVYAEKLFPDGDARANTMVAMTNAAMGACDSLAEAMGIDYQQILQDPDAATDDVFDLVIWSLLFIEAEQFPELELPAATRVFSPALWRYLQTVPLPDADTFADGAWSDEFIEIAYLATHIAYIPTGNHRHPIYPTDSPELYRFHRENFYPVLEMGELDLVAEIVDSLRQYGCDERNDQQVRDGTRYLLNVFHDGGDRWMAYREPGETDADVDDYDLIHKAWTGVLGVRARNLEPSVSGTYGGAVRRWLPSPS